MNGRMKKKCGHSFKIWNKIPVHLIHLAGKMIHYGKNIAYIFVIIPDSNKRFFWNCTPLLGGHSGFLKTYHKVRKEFFWDELKYDIQKVLAEFLV